MMNNVKVYNYKNALVEVEAVLKCLEYEDYCKIPKEVIDAISINQNKDYIFEYDENLDFKDWKLMPETKALLYNLFKKYLVTSEQKQYFIQKEKLEIMQLEREKTKRYNTDVLFKDKKVNRPSENESPKLLIEFKEKWYNKIFNFIKKLFKKN